MMLAILGMVYSLPFFWGALAGSVLWKLYCRQKARYEDMHHPLPDGQRHAVARMSRQWLAGLAAVLSLGYVLLATEKTQEHTIELNHAVARCWAESYQSAKAQIDLNAQNDAISRQQQELQRQYDRDTSQWLKDLVAPPGDLANKPSDSPERKAYGIQRTIQYQVDINSLGAQFDASVEQRHQLDAERAQHPLPETTCGK